MNAKLQTKAILAYLVVAVLSYLSPGVDESGLFFLIPSLPTLLWRLALPIVAIPLIALMVYRRAPAEKTLNAVVFIVVSVLIQTAVALLAPLPI